MPRTSREVMLMAPLLWAACAGQIEDRPGSRRVGAPDTAVLPASVFECTAPGRRGFDETGARRLSDAELETTLRAILGATFEDEAIREEVASLPDDRLKNSVSDFSPTHPADYAGVLERVAARVTALVDAQRALQDEWFGTCARDVKLSASCVRDFVTRFGAKVYRRPLNDDEVAFYVQTAADAGSGVEGLEGALYVLLQAPPLAFHLEYGVSADAQRRRLTDFEVAGRIAYRSTGAPPDELLRAAAAAGQLQETAVVREQVARLLAADSAAARERIRSFFTFYGDLGSVDDPDQDVGKQQGLETAGLGELMREEASDFSDAVFWGNEGTFAALMTSPTYYPREERLAKVLGTSVASAGIETATDRPGLLHHPALLASSGLRTSPILRGAHVRLRYLCETLGLPDPQVVDAVVKQAGDIENQSNRAKVTQLTSAPACNGCHGRINPVGFAFEGFDQLGVSRTVETLSGPNAVGPFAIDTRVVGPLLDANEPAGFEVANSSELARAMAHSRQARACFVQRAFEFTSVRAVQPEVNGCGLAEAESAASSGTLRDVMIAVIANEDIFWRREAN